MEIFENQQIDISILPKVEDAKIKKPQKSYLIVTLMSTIFFWLFIGIIILIGIQSVSEEMVRFVPFLLIAICSISIVSLVITWKSFHTRGYALRNYDILYREGVLYTSLTTISFNRIQHCEITQGPIERLFNLKTLKVFTAGGQSSDLEIPGLTPEEAKQLKEFIIDSTSSNKTIGEEAKL